MNIITTKSKLLASTMKSSISIGLQRTAAATSQDNRLNSSRTNTSKTQTINNKKIRVKNVQFQTPSGERFSMMSS